MKFTDIYESVAPLWGSEIDISDGRMLEDDGFISDNLVARWNRVEEEVGILSPWSELMVWTIYQILHRTSLNQFRQNNFALRITDMSKVEVEAQYFENLQGKSWKKELSEYERD